MRKPRLVKDGKSQKFSKRRTTLRERFWPNSGELIWSRHTHVGFTTIPRTLPLILRLIKELSPKGKGDPSRVYFDLWSRVYDEGFVEVTQPDDFAYAAGYTGTRALRTWREHVQLLAHMGFIRTEEQGNRDIAYVLILNPHEVVAQLRSINKVPKEWWTAFVAQAEAIKADIPNTEESVSAKSA